MTPEEEQKELEQTLEHIHVEYFETGDDFLSHVAATMPSPNADEIASEPFEALWQVVKQWDINVPEYYQGYCSGNGSHVKILLDAIKPFLKEQPSVKIPRF